MVARTSSPASREGLLENGRRISKTVPDRNNSEESRLQIIPVSAGGCRAGRREGYRWRWMPPKNTSGECGWEKKKCSSLSRLGAHKQILHLHVLTRGSFFEIKFPTLVSKPSATMLSLLQAEFLEKGKSSFNLSSSTPQRLRGQGALAALAHLFRRSCRNFLTGLG